MAHRRLVSAVGHRQLVREVSNRFLLFAGHLQWRGTGGDEGEPKEEHQNLAGKQNQSFLGAGILNSKKQHGMPSRELTCLTIEKEHHLQQFLLPFEGILL